MFIHCKYIHEQDTYFINYIRTINPGYKVHIKCYVVAYVHKSCLQLLSVKCL